jgi:hypothetical protein
VPHSCDLVGRTFDDEVGFDLVERLVDPHCGDLPGVLHGFAERRR